MTNDEYKLIADVLRHRMNDLSNERPYKTI